MTAYSLFNIASNFILRQRFVEKIPLDHIAVDRFKEGYLFGSFDTFGDSSDA